MFFTGFLLLHFFAKFPGSKKDFTNWSGQEYLLCLDSRVYNLFTDFPTNMKPILFRIIHADNHPELFFLLIAVTQKRWSYQSLRLIPVADPLGSTKN